MYLDPPPPGSEDSTGDSKGEQLFYKIANLDDRIKNADQVSRSRWRIHPIQCHLIPLVCLSDLPARSDASQQGEPDETPELQTRAALTLSC